MGKRLLCALLTSAMLFTGIDTSAFAMNIQNVPADVVAEELSETGPGENSALETEAEEVTAAVEETITEEDVVTTEETQTEDFEDPTVVSEPSLEEAVQITADENVAAGEGTKTLWINFLGDYRIQKPSVYGLTRINSDGSEQYQREELSYQLGGKYESENSYEAYGIVLNKFVYDPYLKYTLTIDNDGEQKPLTYNESEDMYIVEDPGEMEFTINLDATLNAGSSVSFSKKDGTDGDYVDGDYDENRPYKVVLTGDDRLFKSSPIIYGNEYKIQTLYFPKDTKNKFIIYADPGYLFKSVTLKGAGAEDITVPIEEDGTMCEYSFAFSEDQKSALFEIIMEEGYEVSFDSKGGTPVDSKTVCNGDWLRDVDTPTYGNWVFRGWYPEGWEEPFDLSTPITGPMHLLAKWGMNVPEADIESGSQVSKGTKITLSCLNENAEIYYTLDGTTPTDGNSTLYSGPITINENTQIKAYTKASSEDDSGVEGLLDSEVVTLSYTLLPSCEVVFTVPENVTLKDESGSVIAAGGPTSQSVDVTLGESLVFYVEKPNNYTLRTVSVVDKSINRTQYRLTSVKSINNNRTYSLTIPKNATIETLPITVDCRETEEHTITFDVKDGVTLKSIRQDDETLLTLDENNQIKIPDSSYLTFVAGAGSGKGVKAAYQWEAWGEAEDLRGTESKNNYTFELGRSFDDVTVTLSAVNAYNVEFYITNAEVMTENTDVPEQIGNGRVCTVFEGESISFSVNTKISDEMGDITNYALELVSTSLDETGKITPQEGVYTVTPTQNMRITVKARLAESYLLKVRTIGDYQIPMPNMSTYSESTLLELENGTVTVCETDPEIMIVPSSYDYNDSLVYQVTANGEALSFDTEKGGYPLGKITEDTEVVVSAALKEDVCNTITFAATESLSCQVSVTKDERLYKKTEETFKQGDTVLMPNHTKTEAVIAPDEGAIIEKVTITGMKDSPIEITPSQTDGTCRYTFDFTQEEAKKEVTVTVTLKKAYTVSFNSKGGTSVLEQKIEENKYATKPNDPVRIGYFFDGWHQKLEDGTLAETEFNFDTPITANTELIAKWHAGETLNAPTADPGIATFEEAQNVTLSSDKEGATIYYTVDGSMPTKDSNKYTGPILVTKDTQIKAFASKEGFFDSPVVSFTYYVGKERNFTLKTTNASPKWTISTVIGCKNWDRDKGEGVVSVTGRLTVTVTRTQQETDGIFPQLTYRTKDGDTSIIEPNSATSSTTVKYIINGKDIENGAELSLSDKNESREIFLNNRSSYYDFYAESGKGSNFDLIEAEGNPGHYMIIPKKLTSSDKLNLRVLRKYDKSVSLVLTYIYNGVEKKLLPTSGNEAWGWVVYSVPISDLQDGTEFILEEKTSEQPDNQYTVQFSDLYDAGVVLKNASTDTKISESVFVKEGEQFSFYLEKPDGYTLRSVKINSKSVGYRYAKLSVKKQDERIVYTIRPSQGAEIGSLTIDIDCRPTKTHTMLFKVGSNVVLQEITTNDGGKLYLGEDNRITFSDDQSVSLKAYSTEDGKAVKCVTGEGTDKETLQADGIENNVYEYYLGRNYDDAVVDLSSETPYQVSFDIIDATVEYLTNNAMVEEDSYIVMSGDELSFMVRIEEGYLIDSVLNGTTPISPKWNDEISGYVYTVKPTKDTIITVKARPINYSRLKISVKGICEDFRVYECYNRTDYNENDEEIQVPALEEILPGENGEILISELRSTIALSVEEDEYTNYAVKVNGTAVSKRSYGVGDEKQDVYLLGTLKQDTEVVIETSMNTAKYNSITLDGEKGKSTYYAKTQEDEDALRYVSGDKIYTIESSANVSIKPMPGYEIKKVLVTGVSEYEISEEYECNLSFPEENVTAAKITVETNVIPSEEEKRITFYEDAQHLTYSVTTDVNTVMEEGSNHTYNVKGDYLKFTVKASLGYQPVVTFMDSSVEDNITEERSLIAADKKTSSGTTTYTYMVPASSFTDGIIRITEEETLNDVTVNYDPTQTKIVSAWIGTKEVSPVSTKKGILTYNVPNGLSLVVSVESLSNCTITKAEVKTGTAKPQKVSIKAAGGNVTVKATDSCTLTVSSQANYSAKPLILKKDDTDTILPLTSNKVYTVNVNHTYEMGVIKGVSQKVSIRRVDVLVGSKNAASKAVIDKDDPAKVMLTIAQEDANKKLTVKLYDASYGELAATYTLNVTPIITGVKVTGTKKNNTTKEMELSQIIDQEKSYKITMSPSKAAVELLDVKTDPVNSSDVMAEINNGQLVITTGKEAGKEVKVTLLHKEEGNEYITITVKTTSNDTLSKIKPTVKLASSDDKSLNLTVGTPKSVALPKTGKLYYKVTVTPQPKSATDQNEKPQAIDPIYVEQTGLEQNIAIPVINPGEGKDGYAWKFDVNVELIQTKDSVDWTTNASSKEGEAVGRSGVQQKKNLATKNFCPETKLSLKSGTTTVYTGQQNVLIATPKYSSNTTIRELYNAEDTFDGGKLTVAIQEGNVYVNTTESTALGDHVIRVSASNGKGGAASSKDIKIKVVQGIEKLEVKVPSDRIYKPEKGAGTLKANVEYNDGAAPAKKKVTWSIVNTDGSEIAKNSRLYNMVKIKNGTVTVDKNYVLTENMIEDCFRIKVTADDYKGSAIVAVSDEIQITTNPLKIGHLAIVKENGDGDYIVLEDCDPNTAGMQIKRDDLNNAKVIVFEKGVMAEKKKYTNGDIQQTMDPAILTFKSSSAAKLSIAADGTLTASGKQNNVTITVSTNDGGKNSMKITKLCILE